MQSPIVDPLSQIFGQGIQPKFSIRPEILMSIDKVYLIIIMFQIDTMEDKSLKINTFALNYNW